MITETGLRRFFAGRLRVIAARSRAPAPTLSRYIHHNTWHVCQSNQRDLVFDDARWIEVAW